MSAIMGGGDSGSIILGGNFLRAFYTVYKYDSSSQNAVVRTLARLLMCCCARKGDLFAYISSMSTAVLQVARTWLL